MARMRYDAAVDALAIELTEGARSARTVRVTDTVRLDFDRKGRLITIEVLDASSHVDRAALEQLPTAQDLLTLQEAAAESGLSATTLRVQLNAGRLNGVKRGRDWYVDATSLWNYLESRSSRGRPAASGARRGASSGERSGTASLPTRKAASSARSARRKAAK